MYYPWPAEVKIGNRNEFTSLFLELCNNFSLKVKPITDYNLQGNSIVEQVHQVLVNSLRTFKLEKQELNENDPFEEFLTATAYAIRSTYHMTIQVALGQLVFR